MKLLLEGLLRKRSETAESCLTESAISALFFFFPSH